MILHTIIDEFDVFPADVPHTIIEGAFPDSVYQSNANLDTKNIKSIKNTLPRESIRNFYLYTNPFYALSRTKFK